ncbi:hypothetical protein NL108_001801 [Boleophthalmus pectinirostris]|uniref:BCL2 modifying factor 2 isoform X1 n=2 Tax=Boleophthalmus pectinirostris TaxID=150288 RepID=UPI000A1C2EB4|nr:BCL2 modifying factor 2 isoform X1 [Boleophthalmus pectinirostris]KAJ0060939.1 hypothetical protein NL108_001801 [Boleophthalmus pectinirostris]
MPGQILDERTRRVLAYGKGHSLKYFYPLFLVNEYFSYLILTEDVLIDWFKRLHLSSGLSRSLSSHGTLPLRRHMEDEEDMSRPISQFWGTPFRDIKYEDPTSPMAAGQALAAVTVAVPTAQSHNNSISINALPCSLHWQPRTPFHGNAGLRAHFPAQFEPMEDRGERSMDEEEEGREEEENASAQRNEEPPAVSAEAQIGRKLREIGDKFHQDHMDVFMRHQRQNLPAWMRLTIALFGFLFPREPVLPRLQGQQR